MLNEGEIIVCINKGKEKWFVILMFLEVFKVIFVKVVLLVLYIFF